MVRVAILSFWHVHAKDYARDAKEHPAAEVVAIWDEDPARGQAEAGTRGVRFVAELDNLLADPEIDGVVITTATTAHRQVMLAAAAAGKHIFTEKVIAPTRQEADEIVAAIERAGVAFVVSLPRIVTGFAKAIKAEIASGRVGDVTYARVRVAHDGALAKPDQPHGWLPARFFDHEDTAGGALIDLGAHPLYLLAWILGLPQTVSATYGAVTGREVDDNAVVTLGYANGAIGVAEVAFVSRSPLTIEVHGTAGSLLFGMPDDRVWVREATSGPRGGWVARPTLPEDGPGPFAQWIAHIQDGTRATENVALALDLSSLAGAANRSAAEGRVVYLNSASDDVR